MRRKRSILTIYHGTDIKGANLILRTGQLRGDPPLFGPAVCTRLTRAMSFAVHKCGRRVRRVGRVIELTVEHSLIKAAAPDTTPDTYTLDAMTALHLDDSRVINVRILTPRQWDRMNQAAR